MPREQVAFSLADALAAELRAGNLAEGPWKDALCGVVRARRFIFEPDACLAAEQLSSDLEQFERARPYLFAPFPLTFVEWSNLDERGKPIGIKFGCLLDTDDVPHRTGRFSFFGRDGADRPRFIAQGPLAIAGEEVFAAALSEIFQRKLNCVLPLLGVIASHGISVSHRPVLDRVNRARVRAGKFPYLAFTLVRLTAKARAAIRPRDWVGDGSSPEHAVRAHLRWSTQGRLVIVSSYVRGNRSNGIRQSRYQVEQAGAFNVIADLGAGHGR